ncbi:helix-turn-helix domain-containing protein [Macrococcoides canis]|uniref:helix-turn-helix domain-containing protein n=1 Tax=Macrococcoides canis TaxID=1855823 RepID=UPI0010606400|nr:helix-turn-helix transcriptional regulator [Macrococcus canis]TDM23480.1 XRE family transcriptional regulator [Macrococcus canis]
MLKSNLSVLMAERGMKIADLHEKTNISKTTLMALADNTGKGVQFDTVDKLCVFFGVTPKEFFSYSPYILSFNRKKDKEALDIIALTVKTKHYSKTFYLSYWLRSARDYEFPLSDHNYDIWLSLHIEESDSYDSLELLNIIKSLPVTFESDLIMKLVNVTREIIREHIEASTKFKVDIQHNNEEITIEARTKILLDIFPYEEAEYRKMEDLEI